MRALWIVLCLLCACPAPAAPPAVVVVLLPGTSLRDWQRADAPTLHRLMDTGAVGVLSTRTAHRAGQDERGSPEAALLTLGAGSRAAAPPASARFLPADSRVPGLGITTAGALWQRRTGHALPPGVFVCPDWPAVAAANQAVGYDLRLGSLADTLAAHGIAAAAGGGPAADWPAAGGDGTVRRVLRLDAKPGVCLFWDAGPDLRAADAQIALAASQITALQGRLVVLSPCVQGRRSLAPVLLWGPGLPPGLIVSPSTRRAGLGTNTDFAPAVAAFCGIGRREFQTPPFGFAWTAMAAPRGATRAAALAAEAERQAAGMALLPFLAVALGVWIAAVTRLGDRAAPPALPALLPAAALIAALVAGSALSFAIILVGLLAALLALRRIPAARLLRGAAAVTVVTLCGDMLTGSTLMHRGLLGYSALEGARYYGLGNEAMGLLLGAALVAAQGFWEHRQRFLLAGGMFGVTLLLGTAGAKAGGVLVSLAVFGAFLVTASGRRWTPKTAGLLLAAVIGGLAAAALGDALLGGGRSHLGEAVRRIGIGGAGEAWDIAARKLAVEGRLAWHSAWAALLWLGAASTLSLWRQAEAETSEEKALRVSGVVGFAATLLLNDAGVVAAAIFGALVWSAAMTQKKPAGL